MEAKEQEKCSIQYKEVSVCTKDYTVHSCAAVFSEQISGTAF